MSSTYAQIAGWKNSSDAIDRVTISVVTYARFILGEDPATPNHALRANWAKNAFANAGGVAAGLLHAVAIDGNIRDVLESATDAAVQSATEFAVNQVLNF